MLVPLYLHHTEVHTFYPMIDVDKFLKEASWDYVNMEQNLSENVVNQVTLHMNHIFMTHQGDNPRLTKTRRKSLVQRVPGICYEKESM